MKNKENENMNIISEFLNIDILEDCTPTETLADKSDKAYIKKLIQRDNELNKKALRRIDGVIFDY